MPEMKHQYLVIGRCGMDDIPIRLCDTRTEADLEACATTEDRIRTAALDVMRIDVSVFCNVSVVEFADGVPVSCVMVKEFDD